MADAQDPPGQCCSFCGRSPLDVRTLSAGPGDKALICNICVSFAVQYADFERRRSMLDGLLALAKKRSRREVTCAELNAALPPEKMSADEIEEVMTSLSELGITVIDDDS